MAIFGGRCFTGRGLSYLCGDRAENIARRYASKSISQLFNKSNNQCSPPALLNSGSIFSIIFRAVACGKFNQKWDDRGGSVYYPFQLHLAKPGERAVKPVSISNEYILLLGGPY